MLINFYLPMIHCNSPARSAAGGEQGETEISPTRRFFENKSKLKNEGNTQCITTSNLKYVKIFFYTGQSKAIRTTSLKLFKCKFLCKFSRFSVRNTG
jgi:hypothetical protein